MHSCLSVTVSLWVFPCEKERDKEEKEMSGSKESRGMLRYTHGKLLSVF